MGNKNPVRINKYFIEIGVCSRQETDKQDQSRITSRGRHKARIRNAISFLSISENYLQTKPYFFSLLNFR